MTRLTILSLLLAPVLGLAQEGAVPVPQTVPPAAMLVQENTLQLCGDNFDNDGDGFVDCDDQDCGATLACQSRHRGAKARKKAMTELTIGRIFLPVGFVIAGVSTPLWFAGNDTGGGLSGQQQAAIALDVLGGALVISGAVLVAVGNHHLEMLQPQ